MKQIRFSEEAKTDIRNIPQDLALNVLRSIHRLADNGAGDVKKLKDVQPPEFRLRVGRYRVRFSQQADELHIHSVKNRKDAYRD